MAKGVLIYGVLAILLLFVASLDRSAIGYLMAILTAGCAYVSMAGGYMAVTAGSRLGYALNIGFMFAAAIFWSVGLFLLFADVAAGL